MSDNKPSKQALEKLATQIREDQSKVSPAEKRVKIDASFDKTVKKMAQTPPPKKKTE